MASYYYSIADIENKFGYESGIAKEARRIDESDYEERRYDAAATRGDGRISGSEIAQFEPIAKQYIADKTSGFTSIFSIGGKEGRAELKLASVRTNYKNNNGLFAKIF